ncbi:hypothetical protein CSB93_7044 (plasmid) [Pseudomonas paraeruginosa]|uniref:Uncharacterized protein n=1 Tax=Pseudomonas paraeruginosa TaxID=2994495 RepID=A0A2R3IKU0_9PSED|nr:hypothetical protein CSB93_7044 [Pseudomonas paraeruginosa]AWE88986.1 hypothetical protein CSC28_7031 [Pseudomonas paraeruginosa]
MTDWHEQSPCSLGLVRRFVGVFRQMGGEHLLTEVGQDFRSKNGTGDCGGGAKNPLAGGREPIEHHEVLVGSSFESRQRLPGHSGAGV